MAREGGQEDYLLQLLETRTYHCRVPGEQKQAYNLQEALQKEGLESYRDSQSESEEEVDKANVRIMANDNTPKVISEPSLDDCELTMDELSEVFEELCHNYDFLKKIFKIEKEK